MKTLILSLIAVGVTLVVLSGCDSPTGALPDPSGVESDDFASILAGELQLDSDQREIVRSEMRRHDPPEISPTSLWHVAARLQQALTERQKEQLLALAQRERNRNAFRLVGVYGPCGPDGSDADVRPERDTLRARQQTRLQLSKRAMTAVLELTERQVAALDELHRQQCQAFNGLSARARSGDITREAFWAGLARLLDAKQNALADVLDEHQLEIAAIHDALLMIHARRYLNHVF